MLEIPDKLYASRPNEGRTRATRKIAYNRSVFILGFLLVDRYSHEIISHDELHIIDNKFKIIPFNLKKEKKLQFQRYIKMIPKNIRI